MLWSRFTARWDVHEHDVQDKMRWRQLTDAGQGREGVLLADDQFIVTVGNVAFDFVVEYQIGEDALRLVQVDVVDLHEFQRLVKRFDGNLVSLHQQRSGHQRNEMNHY